MEVEYDYTVDDQHALLDYNFKTNPRVQQANRTSDSFLVGFIIILFVLALLLWLRGVEIEYPVGIAIGAIVSIPLVILVRNLVRSSIRKVFTNSYLKSYSQSHGVVTHHKLSITTEGLIDQTKETEGKTRWNAIKSVEAADQGVVISLRIGPYIVPRRAFPTEEAFKQFVATAQQYKAAAG